MSKFNVIFDMDGVLVDNSEFHKKAWEEFCIRHKIKFTDEDMNKIFGSRNDYSLEYIFKRKLPQEEVEKYGEEKEEIYRPFIKPTENLMGFLKLLRCNNIVMSVGTSADGKNLSFVLEALNIDDYFRVKINSDEVSEGKPSPEIYLNVAKKLNVSPTECIVVEDSVLGIESAISAGMKVIAITTTHKREELHRANLIINNFSELNVEFLECLANN